MNSARSKQASEYQLQSGMSNAGCQLAKDDSQTNSLRYEGPTRVGILTPLVSPLALLVLLLFGALSTSAKTIRVMTYNIHVGVGMDKKIDLPRIAAVINKQRADLVGLQEVDRGV